jgi:peptide/nickel transport system substrate-binding protein
MRLLRSTLAVTKLWASARCGQAWRRLFALAAVMALPAIGVLRANAESVIRVSANTPVRSLDPAKFSLGALEYNYALLVYSRLVYFDEDLKPIPDLAESWEASPDQKVWTFHLRHGVKFHDGRELDAEDVVATYKRLADPAIGSVIRASAGLVETVEAPDRYTVRFTLKTPYSSWPAITGAFQASILPRDGIDTITAKPDGTGPYRFVSYEPNGVMELARNPDYFEPGLPKVDKVQFRIIPDFSTAIAALERGELDIVWGLPPEHVTRLAGSKLAHVSEVQTGTWEMFGMNQQLAPFNEPKVREALFKLVDRAAIADIALFGHGTPTISPLPPFHPFYDKAIPIGKSDPAAAQALLAEAGHPDGLTVPLWMPAQQPLLERMGVALRELAKPAKLTVELHQVPEDQYNAAQRPLMINSFFARTTPDTMLYEWYHSAGSWNRNNWHYSNPEVDKILDAARQTGDVNEQKRLYTRFQEIAVTEGPGPVLFVVNHADGVGNRVQGFAASRLSVLNLKGVTLSN